LAARQGDTTTAFAAAFLWHFRKSSHWPVEADFATGDKAAPISEEMNRRLNFSAGGSEFCRRRFGRRPIFALRVFPIRELF